MRLTTWGALLLGLLLAAGTSLAGCGEDDPAPEGDGDADTDADTDADGDTDGDTDADGDGDTDADGDADCQPLETDYTPRVNGSADDSWDACVSDDDLFHPLSP